MRPTAKRVEYLEGILSYDSPEPFFYPEQYHQVETDERSPEETAEVVIKLVTL